MRERAAAAGGTIEIGPLPSRGFRVTARFPLDPTVPAEHAQPGASQPETSQPETSQPESATSQKAHP
jgi:hypothetical protein